MANPKYALIDDTFSAYRSQHLRVKVAESAWEKQGYFQLRKQIFSKEQKILPQQETDAMDFRAIPIIAMVSSWHIEEAVVGAVRIYRDPNQGTNTWYGGRLCVAKSYRGMQNIGKSLINEAVSRAIDSGCTRFLAKVQKQNEAYFNSLHWHSLEEIEVAGRSHVHMCAQLDKYPFMARGSS